MVLRRKNRAGNQNESGQAVTEYMLLLVTIIGGFLILSRGIARLGVTDRLLHPIRDDFAKAYRYGHPEAKGYDEGSPANHPRIVSNSDNNFRIFISPEVR
ncbi:MAG: hypothetical protein NDJ89_00875 [Oligoflexia bacterium]|nr:hypothetical protein [Oligoflexia bacterium]